MSTKRLLILSRYARKGPSSRLRFFQYEEHLQRAGFETDFHPFFPDDYVESIYTGHRWGTINALRSYAERLGKLAVAHRYDLIWMEKEIFPFLPATVERMFGWSGVRYAVDYDDAWYLRYRAHPSFVVRHLLPRKIEAVIRNAALVTAGNPILSRHARENGARKIFEVPTVLDTDSYRLADRRDGQPVRIVWIGTALNSRYLVQIAPALAAACAQGRAELTVIGGHAVELPGIPARFEAWDEASEPDRLAAADIGIMPLTDTEWERGKCGFKLLQYMAAGLPVVASPVGVNATIVTPEVGYLASSDDEWRRALDHLIDDPDLRHRMGRAGRDLVERSYSLRAWGPRLAEALLAAAGEGRAGAS